MAAPRDDLGRAARKRGIEGQVTTIRHFGIRCMKFELEHFPSGGLTSNLNLLKWGGGGGVGGGKNSQEICFS